MFLMETLMTKRINTSAETPIAKVRAKLFLTHGNAKANYPFEYSCLEEKVYEWQSMDQFGTDIDMRHATLNVGTDDVIRATFEMDAVETFTLEWDVDAMKWVQM